MTVWQMKPYANRTSLIIKHNSFARPVNAHRLYNDENSWHILYFSTFFSGKDKIIFVTESDHAEPSKVQLPEVEDEAEYEGLIKPNGEINWECPCLGGMATGVCGEQFKAAFSCFHTSTSEPKGSDCIEQFRTMQECFREYPETYGEFESVDSADDEDDQELFDFVDEQKEIDEEDNSDIGKENSSSSEQNDGVLNETEKTIATTKEDLWCLYSRCFVSDVVCYMEHTQYVLL